MLPANQIARRPGSGRSALEEDAVSEHARAYHCLRPGTGSGGGGRASPGGSRVTTRGHRLFKERIVVAGCSCVAAPFHRRLVTPVANRPPSSLVRPVPFPADPPAPRPPPVSHQSATRGPPAPRHHHDAHSPPTRPESKKRTIMTGFEPATLTGMDFKSIALTTRPHYHVDSPQASDGQPKKRTGSLNLVFPEG